MRSPGRGRSLFVIWMFASLGTPIPRSGWALGSVDVPPDLLDPGTYPGIKGILELEGRTVHNCNNLLLHVTNFGLIGSEPGSRQPFAGAPSAQWPAGSSTEYLYV